MKLKNRVTNKLSTKLINFLPILKADINELIEKAIEISKENPLLEVKNKKFITYSNLKKSITDEIEILTISKNTLYEDLINQIENSNLFPTKISIAYEILNEINKDGFFEGDEKEIAKKLNINIEKLKIRYLKQQKH